MGWSTPGDPVPPHRPDLDALDDYSAPVKSAVPVSVRASSNEARDGLSPAVRAAVTARLETVNRYPQLGGGDLAATIATHLGAAPEEVVAADGALSLLNYVLLAHCRPGSRVVHAWRSYEAYPICVRTAGAEPVGVPTTPAGAHDLAAMAAAVDEHTAAVVVCTPNNPTGAALTHTEVAGLLAGLPPHVLVVLDEAYADFVDPDASDPVRARELLAAYPQLVVLRTFSKAYGLAGLRVGYAVAAPPVVRAVRKILPPFAVNALAEVAVAAALGDPAHRDAIVAEVRAQRAEVERLVADHGVPVVPSQANFVWLPLGAASAELGRLCAEQGVSTRVFAGEGIRVSVGEPELPARLAAALGSFRAS